VLEVYEVEAGGRRLEFVMRVRRALRAIGLAVVAGAILLAAAAWFMGSLLVEPQNHTVTAPAGFSAERVSIPGVGHAVSGWWVDAGIGTPVVLLVHGLGADRSSMVPRAELLKARGFSSLLIDLQGEGETKGEAITMGHRESRNVIAARDWIRMKVPGQQIGVIGTSLGGAQLEPRLHISVSELEPIRWIGKLGAPVRVAAGSRDQHTTLEESQELFDAAVQPKSLWIVEGAKHQDMLAYDRQGYEEHVVGFLRVRRKQGH
jgi:alpha-beta hydrolase superfamily lysophospholipase